MYGEGLFGKSKNRLNWESRLHRSDHEASQSEKNGRGLGYRAGLDVIGYTGFVPGKRAGNVFAKTFGAANHASQKLKRTEMPSTPQAHDAYVEKMLRKFAEISPSHSHGNFPMYRINADN